MGIVSALMLVVPLGLGWLVDTLLHTLPALTLVGLLVGVVAAGRYTYLEFRKFLRN
jgi:F0F1-type ATP synthase assembly protein I